MHHIITLPAGIGNNTGWSRGNSRQMALNKKQQKQIDAAKNKIQRLQQLLNAARKQPDDPREIPKLEKEIADLNAEIERVRREG
jgi:peptidoglycan hydrolase CwlO-like protein